MDKYDAMETTPQEEDQDEIEALSFDNGRMLDAEEVFWIFRADPNPQ